MMKVGVPFTPTKVSGVSDIPALWQEGYIRCGKASDKYYPAAHHCVGNHPANRIMKDFYHPNFQRLEVPAILGLTASPIVKAKPNQLRQVSTQLSQFQPAKPLSQNNRVQPQRNLSLTYPQSRRAPAVCAPPSAAERDILPRPGKAGSARQRKLVNAGI